MTEYASIFIPVFQLEIGVYGLGSTLENVQKIKAQVDKFNCKSDCEADKCQQSADADKGIENG